MSAQVVSIRPARMVRGMSSDSNECGVCAGKGFYEGLVGSSLTEAGRFDCFWCHGTGSLRRGAEVRARAEKMLRASWALKVIFQGFAVALVCWTGSAQAAELDVCHAYAESRYQEVMQATAGEADFEAQRLYDDAYEDCEWGGRGFRWGNAPLSDVAGDDVVDPWAID